MISLAVMAVAVGSVVTSWDSGGAGGSAAGSVTPPVAVGGAVARQPAMPAVVVATVPESGDSDSDEPTPMSPPATAPVADTAEDDGTDSDDDGVGDQSTETTAPPVAEAAGPPRSGSLVITGVIVPDRTVGSVAANYGRNQGGYDFGPFFASISDEIAAADLSLCHLDGTIGPGLPPAGAPAYRAPEQLLLALAEAGWDGCSISGGNLLGGGDAGVTNTVEAFGEAGLGAAGAAVATDGRIPAVMYDVNGIAVAHLSYGMYPGDGDRLDGPAVAVFDSARVAADAAEARSGGAEFVIVSVQWDSVGVALPSTDQVDAARAIAVGGGVDLVVGVSSGVMQHVERVEETWVLYGLGNFVTSQSPSCCGTTAEDGVIFHLEIGDVAGAVRVTSMAMTPTWLDRTYMEVVPIATRLTESGLPSWYRALSERAFDRTVAVLRGAGAEIGLTVERP